MGNKCLGRYWEQRKFKKNNNLSRKLYDMECYHQNITYYTPLRMKMATRLMKISRSNLQGGGCLKREETSVPDNHRPCGTARGGSTIQEAQYA